MEKKMLSQLTKFALDKLEKEPEKVKEWIDTATKLYENRKLVLSQKDVIVKGIEGVENMVTSATSYFGSFLKGK